MATAATANAQDVLATWAANGGPTDDEKIEFTNQVLEQLADSDMVNVFLNNVKHVGIWALQINETFDKVARSFAETVPKFAKAFPGLSTYYTEWIGYQDCWASHLSLSRDVASEHVTLLKRLYSYLDVVERIVTDQDRVEAIIELQQFIDEEHNSSENMSQKFLVLKRDIEGFINRLGQFIQDHGVDLPPDAKKLKDIIGALQSDIAVLDGKINDASIALGATFFSIIGMAVSGGFIASYRNERNEKAAVLATKQAELADAYSEQEHALASLKGYVVGLMPDITSFCGKQLLFAEIWSSIQSQSVQFQEHLKGGVGALSNMRFKKEMRVAREMCALLQVGLEKYVAELAGLKF